MSLPVEVEQGTGGFHAIAVDLGVGGMFVEASATPAFGVKIVIVVELPGAPRRARLPAIVRWINERGFGVQFLALGARETHALSELVASAGREEAD